jgi:hypothetical protein
VRDEQEIHQAGGRGPREGGLDVLVTSIDLDGLAGANLYVRDVAMGLQATGHHPTVYSPRLGVLAKDLRAAGIPVVVDLDDLESVPQVVHANQTVQAYEAAIRFPSVPIVFVCHGPSAWMAEPPRLDGALIHVAVGTATQARLLDAGVPHERLRLIPNGVDTDRFQPSGRRLPEQPQRALVFSNNAVADGGYAELVRQACTRRGIQLDVRGRGVGLPIERPEEELPSYDLVFARGRCAREAIACGCGVVLMDIEGMATFVGPEEVRPYDGGAFGSATFTRTHDVDAIGAEIDRFDPAVVLAAAELLRHIGSLQVMTERLVDCYLAAMEGNLARQPDPAADLQALLQLLPTLSGLGLERDELHLAKHLLHQHAVHLEQRVLSAEPALDQARAELAQVRAELGQVRSDLAHVEAELVELRGTRVVRARNKAFGAGRAGAALRSLYRPFRR